MRSPRSIAARRGHCLSRSTARSRGSTSTPHGRLWRRKAFRRRRTESGALRDELLGTPGPVKGLQATAISFSISECRDLLFHVQERQFTIPGIASFLEEHKLRFIGSRDASFNRGKVSRPLP